jgi:glycosyltransferase EpsD
MKYFKEQNYIVHAATSTGILFDYCDKKINIPIHRTPFHFGNVIAIFKLKKVVQNEKYDLISCSTPMGGVVARLASIKARKKYGTKVIYTAHGFHFFKGCSYLKYKLYYYIEKHLAKFTDVLVTINEEDYSISKSNFNVDTRYIKGIGYNDKRLENTLTIEEKNKFRKQLGLKQNDYIILYIAEYSKRKRQKYLIETISKIKDNHIKLLLIGNNLLNNKIYNYVKKYKVEDKVKILGFRDDISSMLDIADLVVSTSSQEGLPLNIMEAMHKEKPIIVTNCRGNRDLIKHNNNGLIVPLDDKKALIKAIVYLKNNKKEAQQLGTQNRKIIKQYSLEEILPQYIKIYNEMLK